MRHGVASIADTRRVPREPRGERGILDGPAPRVRWAVRDEARDELTFHLEDLRRRPHLRRARATPAAARIRERRHPIRADARVASSLVSDDAQRRTGGGSGGRRGGPAAGDETDSRDTYRPHTRRKQPPRGPRAARTSRACSGRPRGSGPSSSPPPACRPSSARRTCCSSAASPPREMALLDREAGITMRSSTKCSSDHITSDAVRIVQTPSTHLSAILNSGRFLESGKQFLTPACLAKHSGNLGARPIAVGSSDRSRAAARLLSLEPTAMGRAPRFPECLARHAGVKNCFPLSRNLPEFNMALRCVDGVCTMRTASEVM